jgi:pimeloyl-ACP methyl ester carboxylesterase
MDLFVLIHGSGHGGWGWGKVSPLLKKAGHEVLAPDLPGRGSDPTPLRQVSLESYVKGNMIAAFRNISLPPKCAHATNKEFAKATPNSHQVVL